MKTEDESNIDIPAVYRKLNAGSWKPSNDIRSAVSYSNHTLLLDAEGRVYTWGYNGSGRLGLGDDNVDKEVNARRIIKFKTLDELCISLRIP